MARPQRPQDLHVVNGWWLEIPGLVSPHFETVEGLEEGGEKNSIVDAGTNKVYKFGTQIVDFGELTLTRTYQGTPDDIALEELVDNMIKGGLQIPVVLVKTHNRQEVFRLLLDGFNIHKKTWPTFDVNSGDKFLVTYMATIIDLSIIR